MANQNGGPKRIIVRKRTLALPTAKQKSDLIADSLRRKRRQHKKWPEPKDAEAIFNMHFAVHSHQRRVWHAEMTLEIPKTETLTEFFTISATHPTEHGALRAVIEEMENSNWFRYFRKRGVRFRVTGRLEEVYRGYL